MEEKSSTPGELKVEKSLPYRGFKSASLSKKERLLLKTDFSAVFRSPNGRFTTIPLRMLYRRNNLGLSRIGLIIPKKVLRLATARNRQRRLIKEQFRRTKDCLPNADIVLLLNKKVDEKELIQSCDRIWKFLTLGIDN